MTVNNTESETAENAPPSTEREDEQSEEDDESNDPLTEETVHSNTDPEAAEHPEDKNIIPELHDNVYKQPFKDVDSTDPEEVINAVNEMDPQAAVTIEQLAKDRDNIKTQREKLREKLKQKQEEFKKFKSRKENETEELKDTATKDLIEEILPIRDDLARALDQDTEDIRSGVELIKDDFEDLLEKEGVDIVEPNLGAEVNPKVHEVMTRVESDVESGHIVECYRPGYVIDDNVIRPARVTVSGE